METINQVHRQREVESDTGGMTTQDLSFICFSTAHWDAELWTNRQRIMDLRSRGHGVLFVDPGLHSKKYFRRILTQNPKRLLPTHWLRREKENLWIYSPQLFPLYRLSPLIQRLAWKFVTIQVRRLCRQHEFSHPGLWLYSPEAIEVLGKLDESLSLYDCVDNYAATPYYARSIGRTRRFQTLELELLRRVDVVATTSKTLWEEKQAFNPNTFLIPNVGDAEHFRKASLPETDVADDIAHIPHPLIGFVGAINEHKVDFELLSRIALAQPDWHIVLIGPIGGWGSKTDVSSLQALPNIHLLGPRPYQVLPNYIKAFDVCVIPYVINEYTKDVFPLKFFEFLASGKPIVTTALPSLICYHHIVRVAHTHEEFVQCLKLNLRDTETDAEERMAIASQHTWSHRADQLLLSVQNTLAQNSNRK